MEEDNNKYLKYYDLLSQATSASDLISPNVTYIAGDTEEVLYGWYDDGDPLKIVIDPISGKPVIQKQGPEYVDLGLSVLWAKTNLGAENEWDYGKYYAWGETIGYTQSEIEASEDVLFSDEWYKSLPAASISSDLSGQNDVATIALGSGYRMPTKAELQELTSLTHEVVTVGDVLGMRFSGNGNSIFIPFTGYAHDGSVFMQGGNTFIWSLSISSSEGNAWIVDCNYSGDVSVYHDERLYGFSVRPVKIK